MIPFSLAAELFFLLAFCVLPAIALGIFAGKLTCLMLRKHWGVRAATIDAIFASIVMVFIFYTLLFIDNASEPMLSNRYPVFARYDLALMLGAGLTISTLSVVVRHLWSERSTPKVSQQAGAPSPTSPPR